MLAQPLSPLLFLHVLISMVLILNNGLGSFSFGANNIHLIEDKSFNEKMSSLMRDVKMHKRANSKPPSLWNLFGIPGDGYYIEALIGTPAQKVNLLVDTGSSNLAVAGTSSGELDSFFNASQSSSFISLNESHLKVSYSQGWWQGSLGTDLVVVPSVSQSLQTRSFVALITKSHGFYVNGSHWQGILGLAFPELAQPNRTIQPWFDSVISSRKWAAFRREKSAVASVKPNITDSDNKKDPNWNTKASSDDDGLDLDEFIRKAKKLSELKHEMEGNKLHFPRLKNREIVQKVTVNYAPEAGSAPQAGDGVSEPAGRRTSAKELYSSAIVSSHLIQVTDSLIANSSEVIGNGDESEAVIQTVRLGLANKFSGFSTERPEAKTAAKEYVNSTQDEQFLSVIREPAALAGYQSEFMDLTTSNFTEMSLLFEKNVPEITQEVTVKTVTELGIVSAIPLTEFVSSGKNFESQRQSSSDQVVTNLNILKQYLNISVPYSNESSESGGNQRYTDASERSHDTGFRNSSSRLSDIDTFFGMFEPDFSEKEGNSPKQNHFDVVTEPSDGLAQSADSLVNSSASLESFTLELCGPWSSAPLFDSHKGRLSLGASGSCGHPAYETPIVAPWFYEVAVTGVSVGDTRLSLPCSVYNHHASIVDSGTTKLRLPQAALDAVVQALEEVSAELLDEPLPPRFWKGTGHVCWSPVHVAWSRLPLLRIDIALSNSSSFSIELGPRSYLRPVLNAGSSEDTDPSAPANGSDVSVSFSSEDSGSGISVGDANLFATVQDSYTSMSGQVVDMQVAGEDLGASESGTPSASSAGSEMARTGANASARAYVNTHARADASSPARADAKTSVRADVNTPTRADAANTPARDAVHTSSPDANISTRADTNTPARAQEKDESLDSVSTHPSVHVLASPIEDNYAYYLRPKRNVDTLLSNNHEGSHVSFSVDLHVNLNQPSSYRVSDSHVGEKAMKEKFRDPRLVTITTNKRTSLVQSRAQESFSTVAGSSSAVPCWSSGIELSDMGTVLGAVVLEGLCVHFDRGRGVVGFSEGSCGPRVLLSGPHARREAEICAAPHRDVMESGAGEAGTVVLAAILVLLCCPFALFVVRALWRLARHRFVSLQQAETTFLSLDESTSAA